MTTHAYLYSSTTTTNIGAIMQSKNIKIIPHKVGFSVQLYDTIIIDRQQAKNGDGMTTTLNSGGFRTITTKKWMNEYLPGDIVVHIHNNVWYVTTQVGKFVFEDKMQILLNGKAQYVQPNGDYLSSPLG